ncbi:MAG TPA: aspartyl protease family protein [Thermoanaerobaculia bacterium]
MRALLLNVVALVVAVTDVLACSVPLKSTRTSFTASVTVEGEGPFRFLVDTGSSLTVIDRALAQRLRLPSGKPIEAITTSGAASVVRSTVTELRAGSLIVANLPVLVTPLPHFPSHGRVDGIVGMNALANRSFVLDVERRCLDIDAIEPEGTTLAAREVASRVTIAIDEVNFVLDSGASFPVLMTLRARALGVRNGASHVTTAGGVHAMESARIPELRAGNVRLRDLDAVFAPPTGDPREDALLPVTAFRRIYVDAARTRVILQ